MSTENRFKHLDISEWQQFRDISIDFDSRLTVLTGANASGKTTILNLLASHHDWSIPSLATPKRFRGNKVTQFLTRLFHGEDYSENHAIGSLEYTDGNQAKLKVTPSDTPTYNVNIERKREVSCFFVPSHRSVYRYQALSNIPLSKKNKKDAFNVVWNSTKRSVPHS